MVTHAYNLIPGVGWNRRVTFQHQMLSLNSGYWESDAADVINQTESVNPVLFWAQHSWVVPGEVEETTRSGGAAFNTLWGGAMADFLGAESLLRQLQGGGMGWCLHPNSHKFKTSLRYEKINIKLERFSSGGHRVEAADSYKFSLDLHVFSLALTCPHVHTQRHAHACAHTHT